MAARSMAAVGLSLGLGLAATATLSACSLSDDAQDPASSNAGFEFHAPGGQLEIFYEPDERQAVGDLTGESLMDEGETIKLSDYDGQIVVLNAWGQWCAPCRAEVDDLEQVQEELAERQLGTILGINVRDPQRQVAQDFVKDNGVSYPSIYDPPFKSAAALGGVPSSVIPTTIVLDRQHRPAAVFLRGVSAKDVLDVVERIAAEPDAGGSDTAEPDAAEG